MKKKHDFFYYCPWFSRVLLYENCSEWDIFSVSSVYLIDQNLKSNPVYVK